jgi:hypothetical protein
LPATACPIEGFNQGIQEGITTPFAKAQDRGKGYRILLDALSAV